MGGKKKGSSVRKAAVAKAGRRHGPKQAPPAPKKKPKEQQ